MNSDFDQASMPADHDKKLAAAGLIADLQRDMSTTKAEELPPEIKLNPIAPKS